MGQGKALGKKEKKRILDLEDEAPSLLDAMSLLHPGVMLLSILVGADIGGGSQWPDESPMGLGYGTKKGASMPP